MSSDVMSFVICHNMERHWAPNGSQKRVVNVLHGVSPSVKWHCNRIIRAVCQNK